MNFFKRNMLAATALALSLGIASCSKTLEPSASPSGVAFSQHKKIPNTNSSVVTKAQEMHPSLTSVELTRLMGNGINLSNTLEAYRNEGMGTKASPKEYEVLWGQPVTTQELMNGFKAAGFDSIRIPVAWTNAMDYEHGDYRIEKAWLDRVEEVVNYALNAGLYVVINDHWDGDWWGMFGSKTEQTRKDAMELYTAMWTQIANRFKHYSDYLIFEGGNEELGSRLNDVYVCKDSGSLSEDVCYKTANAINQKFVDIVRSSGSNNASRFLLIPGYNTDIYKTIDPRFQMPKDKLPKGTAENRLLVSVHYYTPWGFCGGPSVSRWGTVREIRDMNKNMELMARFVDEGYGVIIGEYATGATESGERKDYYALDWTNNFLDNCDLYNFCPMLWDTNVFFKRDIKAFADPEWKALYASRSYASQAQNPEEDWEIEDRMDDFVAAAPESFSNAALLANAGGSVAWIMYNSQDYAVTYSVGDTYKPDEKTDGLEVTDVEITGPGTYTVGLDFTGTLQGFARSFGFSAIGISNGEANFPDYCITITEFNVDGIPRRLSSQNYTNADDGLCTRTNIYNEWVNDLPDDARCKDGNLKRKRPIIINRDDGVFQEMKTLFITFEYGPAEK